MQLKTTISTLCGVLLLSAASLQAAHALPDHDQDRGRGHHQPVRHQADHRPAPVRQVRYTGMHDRGRHEGWYKRGGYLPRDYRGNTYVVNDWRHDRLRQPPRGYHWVRSDNGDFLLVAITTGLIADLLLHH